MRRLILRQSLLRRLFRPEPQRTFTHHSPRPTSLGSSRPQLPFLSMPSARPRRYFTTEKKRWLKYEAYLVARYTLSIWGIVCCGVLIHWSVNQEILERRYPTPHEWSFFTRVYFRGARQEPDRTDTQRTDWVEIIDAALEVIRRLEDPKIDGAGLRDVVDGGPIYMDGVGKMGYDVSGQSENWRRGYYEAMMLAAKAAEQLDGWVVDRTRRVVFPPDVVIGPSNPRPKPIPFGAESAPKEENCDAAYEPAENFYLRILTTKGFTAKQRMDAALAYASFMDFKQVPAAAERMYHWALSLAVEGLPRSPALYDAQTMVLNDKAGPASANLLTAVTAIAIHKASLGDVSAALPILVSVLKARRSMSSTPPATQLGSESDTEDKSAFDKIYSYLLPPAYPPPMDDGTFPPWRSPKELCQEGALSLHIGEIFYANKNQEEGLAWTREAVDMAEEQLYKLKGRGGEKEAKKTCKECLAAGLENWTKMVVKLAREEAGRVVTAKEKGSSPLSFWSSSAGSGGSVPGRWAAEEEVVEERRRRTRGLLEDVEATTGLGWLWPA